MRKGDSSLLRSFLAENVDLQSIREDKMGKVTLSTTNANELVTTIGTPHKDVYDERIVFGDIKIEGPIANVRTPYKFYLGNVFSHCGVNYFQLAKTSNGWKIIHIGYTSRTNNCKN